MAGSTSPTFIPVLQRTLRLCYFLLQPCRADALHCLSYQASPDKETVETVQRNSKWAEANSKEKNWSQVDYEITFSLLSWCVGVLKQALIGSLLFPAKYHKNNKAFHPTQHRKSITPSLPESIPVCHFPFNIHSIPIVGWGGAISELNGVSLLFIRFLTLWEENFNYDGLTKT